MDVCILVDLFKPKYTQNMPPKVENTGRSAMSSISDAILIETIKKELRFHALYENYMLSPNASKSKVQDRS